MCRRLLPIFLRMLLLVSGVLSASTVSGRAESPTEPSSAGANASGSLSALFAPLPTGAPQQNSPELGTTVAVRPLKIPTETPQTGFRYFDGALVITPQISFDSFYSTNVLQQPTPQGDLALVVAPAINIKYDQPTFGAAFVASGRYTDYVIKNIAEKKEYLVTPSFYGNIADGWVMRSFYKTSQQYISNAALGAVPSALNIIGNQQYRSNIEHDLGSWHFEFGLSLKNNQTYAESVTTSASATLYEYSDLSQINKIQYNFSKTDFVYVIGTVDKNTYTMTDTYDRDSTGLLAAVGLNYVFSDALSLKGQIGYLRQDYADPRFEIVSTFVGFATLNYKMTQAWSAELNWSRLASELVYPGTPGIFINTYDFALKNQYDPKTLYETRAQWIVQEAVQLPIVYETLVLSIGGTYLYNDHLSFEYGYKYNWQITSDDSQNFTEHVVGAGVTYKF